MPRASSNWRPTRAWGVASIAIALGMAALGQGVYIMVDDVEQAAFDAAVESFEADLVESVRDLEFVVLGFGGVIASSNNGTLDLPSLLTGFAGTGSQRELDQIDALVVLGSTVTGSEPVVIPVSPSLLVPRLGSDEIAAARRSAEEGRTVLHILPEGDAWFFSLVPGREDFTVGARFRLDELLAEASDVRGAGQLGVLAVSRESGEELLSTSTAGSPMFVRDVEMEIWGEPVAFEVFSGSEYPRSGSGVARTTSWAFGALVAVLVFGLGSVVRRRREADQERLRLAEELVRSKDRFIASVSHELRTPLTAIVGFAVELSRMTASGQREIHEMAEIVASESGDMAHLIEDLLVAARSEADAITVVPKPVHLAEIAKTVATGVGPRYGSPSVDVVEDLEALADPLRVRQVVRNLVSNAFRHGGHTVRLTVSRVADGASICVSDDGPGIPADRLDEVFLPYHRLADSPTQPASVGLGLTVSRDLALRMGGDLVHRREGDWTVFELILPVPRELPPPVEAVA